MRGVSANILRGILAYTIGLVLPRRRLEPLRLDSKRIGQTRVGAGDMVSLREKDADVLSLCIRVKASAEDKDETALCFLLIYVATQRFLPLLTSY